MAMEKSHRLVRRVNNQLNNKGKPQYATDLWLARNELSLSSGDPEAFIPSVMPTESRSSSRSPGEVFTYKGFAITSKIRRTLSGFILKWRSRSYSNLSEYSDHDNYQYTKRSITGKVFCLVCTLSCILGLCLAGLLEVFFFNRGISFQALDSSPLNIGVIQTDESVNTMTEFLLFDEASLRSRSEDMLKKLKDLEYEEQIIEHQYMGIKQRIVIENQLSIAIDIYWLDSEGREKHLRKVEPFDSLDQVTYYGHMFVIRNSATQRFVCTLVVKPPLVIPDSPYRLIVSNVKQKSYSWYQVRDRGSTIHDVVDLGVRSLTVNNPLESDSANEFNVQQITNFPRILHITRFLDEHYSNLLLKSLMSFEENSEEQKLSLQFQIKNKILKALGIPELRTTHRSNIESFELMSIDSDDATIHVDWIDPFLDSNKANFDVQLGRNRFLSVLISLSNSDSTGLCFPSAFDISTDEPVHFQARLGNMLILHNMLKNGNLETHSSYSACSRNGNEQRETMTFAVLRIWDPFYSKVNL